MRTCSSLLAMLGCALGAHLQAVFGSPSGQVTLGTPQAIVLPDAAF